jgi:hypothetical protein
MLRQRKNLARRQFRCEDRVTRVACGFLQALAGYREHRNAHCFEWHTK